MSFTMVRLGTNDAARAADFYEATFATLGVTATRQMIGDTLVAFHLANGMHLLFGPPRNGEPATWGNGDTLGMGATDAEMVDRWHAAGLASGGTCEGAPGLRESAGNRYGAYLRDPDGHKLCCYAGLFSDA